MNKYLIKAHHSTIQLMYNSNLQVRTVDLMPTLAQYMQLQESSAFFKETVLFLPQDNLNKMLLQKYGIKLSCKCNLYIFITDYDFK